MKQEPVVKIEISDIVTVATENFIDLVTQDLPAGKVKDFVRAEYQKALTAADERTREKIEVYQRKCARCGEPLYAERADKTYCSDSCRALASRDRRNKAVSLGP